MKLKESFIKRAKELMGEEAEEYLKYTSMPLRKSIRVNTLKISVNDLVKKIKGWDIEEIPWYEKGFYVNNCPKAIGNTIGHFLGYYYVQEASAVYAFTFNIDLESISKSSIDDSLICRDEEELLMATGRSKGYLKKERPG